MKDQLILIYSYLHGIWQYRWSALMVSWVVALLGWAAVYALPNKFESHASMHIDTESVIKPLLRGLAVESDVNSGIALMRKLLLSRKNLEEVIRETDMDLEANSPEDMDFIVENFSRSISLTKQRRTDIYELSYEGSSADLVYKVVSKLLNTLIDNTLNSARTDTAAAQKFLERQITDYEKRLAAAEQKLAEFKRANHGVMPDKLGGYYNRLQREQGELDTLRSDWMLAKRKLLQLRKQLDGETPLLGSREYNAPQVMKLRILRERLEILLTQYTEQHPDVRALRNTIADAMANNKNIGEDKFAGIGQSDSVEYNPVYQELKADINKASVEVEVLKLKLTEKEKTVEELNKSVDIIPGVEAKLAKLNRGYEITRERYLRLVERRESAHLAQEVGQSGSNIDFQIIDPPRVATKPSGPNRFLLLTMVFIAAIAAGLGWGVARYFIQPTFIALSQIRDKVGLPILGSVGLFLTAEHERKRKIQLVYFLLAFSLLVVSYGGFLAFREPGSYLFSALI